MKKPLLTLLTFITLCTCATDPQRQQLTLQDLVNHANGEPVVPRNANKVHITIVQNPTISSHLHEILLKKIKEAFAKDGRLAVIRTSQDTDILLSVKMITYEQQHIEFDDLGRVLRKRIRITAQLQCVNAKNSRTIIYEPDMQAFIIFSDTVPPITTEDKAGEKIINELSRRITAKTVTGWHTQLMTDLERGKKSDQ